MFYHSPAKKNKHQNDTTSLSEAYLYSDRDIPKNASIHLSSEIRAQLNDDIFFMRRQFKHNLKKLKHNIDYKNWREDVDIQELNEQVRLRFGPRELS